uniref:S.cerevisiae (S288C) J0909, J0911, J0914 and J0913(RADH) genes n=1 Tax=Saccharomyces cerevisiae TaxID=4932 RepID=A2NXM5_YEASX|nr:unnamed protein product [Saccharomyces cerevisiae]
MMSMEYSCLEINYWVLLVISRQLRTSYDSKRKTLYSHRRNLLKNHAHPKSMAITLLKVELKVQKKGTLQKLHHSILLQRKRCMHLNTFQQLMYLVGRSFILLLGKIFLF